MENIKISVIVACYNVEHYIEQCLSSILNQTYTAIEVIAINDGSTDGTFKVLDRLSKTDNRLLIVNQSNEGLSQVRNNGVLLAKGSHIVFVDGDDWLDANCLFELMSKSLNQELVCCSYNRVFLDAIKVRKLNLEGVFQASHIQRRIIGLTDAELNDPSQADSLVTAWGKLYNSNIIKRNNLKFIDTKIIGTEDALYNIQYLQFCNSVFVIDKPLINYRKFNVTSLTSNYKSSLFNQWKILYSMIYDVVTIKDNKFEIAFNNRVCLSIIGLGLNESLNKDGFFIIYKRLRTILNDPLYVAAFKKLELKYFPIHWKFFFFFAKFKLIFPLQIMLFGIKKMINKA